MIVTVPPQSARTGGAPSVALAHAAVSVAPPCGSGLLIVEGVPDGAGLRGADAVELPGGPE